MILFGVLAVVTGACFGDADLDFARQSRLWLLQNERITESSGVAPSNRVDGVYWTHNDSGDGPNLFAFDETGKDLGVYTLAGVVALDWEDMSSAVVGGKQYLYVGDIGDNLGRRSDVVVYRIPEPDPRAGGGKIERFDTYRLTYPDGPHNCETLLVTPSGGIQLVTKSRDGVCGVYALPAPASSGAYELKRVGEFRLVSEDPFDRVATAGDISPDGGRVVIRTYRRALIWTWEPSGNWFEMKPAVVSLPKERQGEAICFDRAAKRLVSTSEGRPCAVSVTPLPNVSANGADAYSASLGGTSAPRLSARLRMSPTASSSVRRGSSFFASSVSSSARAVSDFLAHTGSRVVLTATLR